MNGADGDVLPVPRPAPRWKLRTALALAVVAALVAGGLKAYDEWFVQCADGVRKRGPDDECIGVTDGAHHFDKSLKGVMERIEEANKEVEKSKKPWVSIGYVEPMTLGPGDKGRDSIRQELEGAYLAQRELNDPSGGHGDTPQIKLLPANPGRGSGQWAPLVDQLAGMTDGKHPMVAVAGFGQSLHTTKKAVEELRKRKVPMVGSTVTADQLSDPERLGFFRAVAPNSDQTSAMAKYLKGLQRGKKDFRIQVIKDRNADDIYSASLLRGFDKAVKKAGLELDTIDLPFVSRGEAVPNSLEAVADKLCGQPELPDAVYFAGRGRDMKGFIESAAATGRPCPVTVYSADDTIGLFFDIPWRKKTNEYEKFLKSWERSEIRIKYTALAHPDASPDVYPGGKANPFDAFRDAYAERFGGVRDLLNGQAMLGHDAVLAVGTAIRDAAGQDGRGKVNKDSVRELLVQINGRHALAGASGKIDFDDAGNPRNKPQPLVELRPRTRDEHEYLRVLTP
ncbi:ABC transporter substrate-binding protein [Streptomyces armeniacus]|uniref:ABC transporter substrate-binding protein n=1 Tax=Streptomyces armeniacus TaxID=83291 RepID=UPI001AD82EB7|nr:ABC transporter substrate-binding protein [Streptomyces armeniacus]